MIQVLTFKRNYNYSANEFALETEEGMILMREAT